MGYLLCGNPSFDSVCVRACTCVMVAGWLFLLSVTHYITLFKFRIIHLALKKETGMFTCRRISIPFLLTWTKYSRESKGSRTCSIRRAISSCLTSLSWLTHAITASNTFQETNKCESLWLTNSVNSSMPPKTSFCLY